MIYRYNEWVPVKGIENLFFCKTNVLPIVDPKTREESKSYGYRVALSNDPYNRMVHDLGWVDVFSKGYLVCHKSQWLYFSQLSLAIEKLYNWYAPNYFADYL